VSGVFAKDTNIQQLEVCYKHNVIWPIMEELAKNIPATKFLPGEIRLNAVWFELRRLSRDNKNFYNAEV
jgi:hypothetical protein